MIAENEVESRIMSAILTGVNRAFPFATYVSSGVNRMPPVSLSGLLALLLLSQSSIMRRTKRVLDNPGGKQAKSLLLESAKFSDHVETLFVVAEGNNFNVSIQVMCASSLLDPRCLSVCLLF